MQGNLNEIDVRSILQLIELGQRTGLLFVEACISDNFHSFGTDTKQLFVRNKSLHYNQQQSWFVFFLNGQIIYAADGNGDLSRLDDYLRHYRVKVKLDETQLIASASQSVPEYNYLWALLEQNIINPTQARSIIHGLVHETIFDLLNLQQGSFIFELTAPLAPQLTTWETAPLVARIIRQVQEWKLFYPHIESPDQLPMLADIVRLRSSLPAATANKLKQWADGKTSLRQLARYLNRDMLTVAKAIYPYIQQGWVQLVYMDTSITKRSRAEVAEPSIDTNKVKIMCIDDAMSICKSVETILKSQAFSVYTFTNPLEALSRAFALKPNLILCDITMPELDGYEICAMLRHTTMFRFLPIIMLTGQDGFINRIRARMVGATDYLTKPFNDGELVMLVKKYLQNRTILTDIGDGRLVDRIEDSVKNIITSADAVASQTQNYRNEWLLPTPIKIVKE
jgi:twitching motility two-component system response regulator PilG